MKGHSFAILWGFRGDTSIISAPMYVRITGESKPVFFAQITYAKTFTEASLQKPSTYRPEHRFLVPVRIVEANRIAHKGARSELPIEPQSSELTSPGIEDMVGLMARRSRNHRSRLAL